MPWRPPPRQYHLGCIPSTGKQHPFPIASPALHIALEKIDVLPSDAAASPTALASTLSANDSALGWRLSRGGQSVRAWLGTVAMWRVSPRLVGDCGYVASQSRLVGDCREVASQSALGWGLSRGGQSVRAWLRTVAMWRVSPRLVGDCREVVSQSALGWGLWRCGESVRACLGTVARWPVSPRLVGDCGDVARQSALGWGLLLCGVAAVAWRVSPRLIGETRH
ncbi:hypothetical protein ACLB2K_012522 [Fragaria x ananassa]